MTKPNSNWPPEDASAYIRTDGFAALVLAVVKELAEKYPHMDFADAVASLFTWLDRKATTEPEFISLERFPTPLAFRAYLRAGAWNVARVTAPPDGCGRPTFPNSVPISSQSREKLDRRSSS